MEIELPCQVELLKYKIHDSGLGSSSQDQGCSQGNNIFGPNILFPWLHPWLFGTYREGLVSKHDTTCNSWNSSSLCRVCNLLLEIMEFSLGSHFLSHHHILSRVVKLHRPDCPCRGLGSAGRRGGQIWERGRGGPRGSDLGTSQIGTFRYELNSWQMVGGRWIMYLHQQPTESSKQPITARYLGHVTGYQPIRDQYFLIRSAP